MSVPRTLVPSVGASGRGSTSSQAASSSSTSAAKSIRARCRSENASAESSRPDHSSSCERPGDCLRAQPSALHERRDASRGSEPANGPPSSSNASSSGARIVAAEVDSLDRRPQLVEHLRDGLEDGGRVDGAHALEHRVERLALELLERRPGSISSRKASTSADRPRRSRPGRRSRASPGSRAAGPRAPALIALEVDRFDRGDRFVELLLDVVREAARRARPRRRSQPSPSRRQRRRSTAAAALARAPATSSMPARISSVSGAPRARAPRSSPATAGTPPGRSSPRHRASS